MTLRRRRPGAVALVATALLVGLLPGCDRIGRYLGAAPEDRLVDAALARWAEPGAPFLDGTSGRDTVASVSPTGAHAWEVAVLPPSGGAPVVWTLDLVRVETYPLLPGDAFVRFLTDQARALGMEEPLPREILAAVASGEIRAAGALTLRYGLAQRTGRATRWRAALLTAPPGGGPPAWAIQDDGAPSVGLVEAVERVADDALRRDEGIHDCMGSAEPSRVPRSRQLRCLAQVWREDFTPAGRSPPSTPDKPR